MIRDAYLLLRVSEVIRHEETSEGWSRTSDWLEAHAPEHGRGGSCELGDSCAALIVARGYLGNQPVWHEGGRAWADVPVPPRLHRCWGQTWGLVHGDHFQRCACGALSLNQGPWTNRNSRKRKWWRW